MTQTAERLSGVLAPVVTPFDARLNPDREKLVRQCRWLLSQNVGLAVFGTNSEANSLSVDEKIELLDTLADAGIDPRRIVPGTGCCALPDTVRLSAHATKLGCAGTLMLPPFYYKGVSDEGLFRAYSEIIERVGDASLKIYLYHIPPIAQVGLSVELIERLISRYPGTVVGIKDSSGDWDNTAQMLERRWDDFDVFVGSESFLLRNMRAGGVGCISATANVNPAAIDKLFREWREPGAEGQQQRLDDIRQLFMAYPMISALKSAVGTFGNDPAWYTVRPPLVPLTETQHGELHRALLERDFTMPGLGEC